MSQWGQPGQQPGYQYSMQTGFPGANPQFQQQTQQNPQFQQGFQQGLAPQQTGFPAQSGFMQPHNFQARPPIPPVPPIPSQFQSPGFGGPGLQSQPTGFPSGGLTTSTPRFAGASPLAPLMTGFVDPRLQMVQSSFMPANTSAPYSAGGIARPQMSWALSKDEKKKYDQIFRAWDPQSTGFLSGQTALEVFGASGLNKNDLARIWYVRRSLLCSFLKISDSQDIGGW